MTNKAFQDKGHTPYLHRVIQKVSHMWGDRILEVWLAVPMTEI